MTKVLNQFITANEILYYEGPYSPGTLGQQYRGVSSIAVSENNSSDWGIVRKSTKSRRPSQRGAGSPKQAKYRAALSQCARWFAELPYDCEAAEDDYEGATKESAFGAKEYYGVVCSYVDLWVRCCLEIIKDIPAPWSFDLVVSCFPDICAECGETSISCATDMLIVNETLEIAAINYPEDAEITWAVSGSSPSFVNPNSGPITTFTAALLSWQNKATAIVSVYANEILCGSVEIPVCRDFASRCAYVEYTHIECWDSDPDWMNCRGMIKWFDCDDNFLEEYESNNGKQGTPRPGCSECQDVAFNAAVGPECSWVNTTQTYLIANSPLDLRSEDMKDCGCEPEVFEE
jgi:hypothetical protein